ncbi:GSU2403 family nucleotidyltransferase fold protein [Alsobacter sp. KACC 23698]|uniref:GSU2403 family nucleotidyltransferase fold protein n=1 Tax=Alsobacter sp. KACC 23698 TaxID=3149229 RepID=A0AAU7JI42_9HYPH
MKPIAPTLLTLYADLVQSLSIPDERAGSVYRHDVKGQSYIYASIRTGQTRGKIYLGHAADPAAIAKADAIQMAAERQKARRKTVSVLRSAGLSGPDKELGRVLEVTAAAGLFQAGAVLVGTSAYQCYSPVVGAVLPPAGMMTRDADIATASLALTARRLGAEEGDAEIVSLEEILQGADPTFRGAPMLDHRAPPSRFRSASGFLVEVLTPMLRRTDQNPMPVPGLRAGAIPIQHMGWLIENPIWAVALHGSGALVRVPQPARYAVHKLLISQKRTMDTAKAAKDLDQAQALFECLGPADADALQDALDDARSRGKKGWAEPIDKALQMRGLNDWL